MTTASSESPFFVRSCSERGRSSFSVPVEEFLGVHGPVRVSEKILHQIWQAQQIRLDRLQTTDGRTVEIVFPGFLNTHAGPDFLNAEIRVAGQFLRGDIEIDFYPHYWFAHQHHQNPRFNNVILHVVLFDTSAERSNVHGAGVTLGAANVAPRSVDSALRVANAVDAFADSLGDASGDRLGDADSTSATSQTLSAEHAIIPQPHGHPVLKLVTYLNKDIESYAYEYALLALEGRSHLTILDAFLAYERPAQLHCLQEKAFLRWTQKCNFAQKRLQEHGWVEACHQYFLEVLGYSQNRSIMGALALQYPYEKLLRAEWLPDELYDAYKTQWKNRGVRPTNRPLVRLKQYHQLLKKSPRWPYDMQLFAEQFSAELQVSNLNDIKLDTLKMRRQHHFKTLRDEMSEDILADVLSSSRLDNWFVDAFLPLASVFTGKNLFAYWYHWFDADAPQPLKTWLDGLGLAPLSNGLTQGTLQLILEQGG